MIYEEWKKYDIAGLIIYQFVWDYIDANSYILTDDERALIIDPILADGFWKFIDRTGMKEASVVLTHEHFDHICGLNELRKKIPCTVYALRKCSQNIGNMVKNLSSVADVLAQLNETVLCSGVKVEPFVCETAEIEIDDKVSFQWMGHNVLIIATPGHSEGSVCVVVDDTIVFTGDTLLRKPIITKLPGGSQKNYREITRPVLNDISEKVKMIFPGHGEAGVSSEFCEFI